MLTYLAAAPAHRRSASAHTTNLAHIAYRIGENSTLLRHDLPAQGGLLCVEDRDAPPIPSAEKLCAAALRECRRQNFSGILLDFERTPSPDRRAFVRHLEALRGSLSLYIPRAYSADAPKAALLIGSAISGGDFRSYLSQLRSLNHPLALDTERLRMDFPLPCPSGIGTPLTKEALAQRMPPATFFSRELCARYFTYQENGNTHFVLFDDAETMNRKVRIAEELGFAAAFFLWPEIEDLANDIHW
ncbi:MAG: hypothetical protein IJC58_01335 [Oscillospiraceae bacterium]|nr:hypothetical protein [Oscillospiraceae bacterium]